MASSTGTRSLEGWALLELLANVRLGDSSTRVSKRRARAPRALCLPRLDLCCPLDHHCHSCLLPLPLLLVLHLLLQERGVRWRSAIPDTLLIGEGLVVKAHLYTDVVRSTD